MNWKKREAVKNVSNEAEQRDTVEDEEDNNAPRVYVAISGVLMVLGGITIYNKNK